MLYTVCIMAVSGFIYIRIHNGTQQQVAKNRRYFSLSFVATKSLWLQFL